jgi:hypothetical protein
MMKEFMKEFTTPEDGQAFIAALRKNKIISSDVLRKLDRGSSKK